jgi:chitin deacetylase
VHAARPGSIIIMHDGGGNRSQTVEALPRIIRTLRHRGYGFVTVTKLLHGHMIWGPAR